MASDLEITGATPASGLVAADHRPARVRLLADTLRRTHIAVPIVRLDARGPLPFVAGFDAVLVDAPCSGLGTLSRDPDLKWTRTADQLEGLAADQHRMLRAAAAAVRPGGRLIYATCSSEPEENVDVVEKFLGDDGSFRPRACRGTRGTAGHDRRPGVPDDAAPSRWARRVLRREVGPAERHVGTLFLIQCPPEGPYRATTPSPSLISSARACGVPADCSCWRSRWS